MKKPILEVNQLHIVYEQRRFLQKNTIVRAVSDVSFTVSAGETLGLVGESGSGKSSIGRAILKLVPLQSGKIEFQGGDIWQQTRQQEREYRRQVQAIFQDSFAALNPMHTVGDIIAEIIKVHHGYQTAKELHNQMIYIMEQVGLSHHYLDSRPHELSGGQAQRVAIARAIATQPALIICDEPTSALDVSVQSKIVNLLFELQERFNIAYLFISHDLAIVQHISDWIGVLYQGQLVEYGTVDRIYQTPEHDYTRKLFNAVLPIPTSYDYHRLEN